MLKFDVMIRLRQSKRSRPVPPWHASFLIQLRQCVITRIVLKRAFLELHGNALASFLGKHLIAEIFTYVNDAGVHHLGRDVGIRIHVVQREDGDAVIACMRAVRVKNFAIGTCLLQLVPFAWGRTISVGIWLRCSLCRLHRVLACRLRRKLGRRF